MGNLKLHDGEFEVCVAAEDIQLARYVVKVRAAPTEDEEGHPYVRGAMVRAGEVPYGAALESAQKGELVKVWVVLEDTDRK